MKLLPLYYEDLLSKMKKQQQQQRKLGSSSESSCHFMQNISTVGKLSEKKNHYNQGMK